MRYTGCPPILGTKKGGNHMGIEASPHMVAAMLLASAVISDIPSKGGFECSSGRTDGGSSLAKPSPGGTRAAISRSGGVKGQNTTERALGRAVRACRQSASRGHMTCIGYQRPVSCGECGWEPACGGRDPQALKDDTSHHHNTKAPRLIGYERSPHKGEVDGFESCRGHHIPPV